MGKKGKPAKASASNGDGAAPAAETSLHGETLQMIKVGVCHYHVAPESGSGLTWLMDLREETRTPFRMYGWTWALPQPSLVRWFENPAAVVRTARSGRRSHSSSGCRSRPEKKFCYSVHRVGWCY